MVIFKPLHMGTPNAFFMFRNFFTTYLRDINRYIAAHNTQPVRLKYSDCHKKKSCTLLHEQ
jgi:hypothetical protein